MRTQQRLEPSARGRMVESGPVADLVAYPKHPATTSLFPTG
jgi:ABC-type oligopeptide transport system ATPase subunit